MNEIRQTLEDWADNLMALYGKRMNQVAQWTAREAIKARLQQAYEAGESAMKEKAAQLANSYREILPPEHRVAATWIGDKIRALPLSGAEEAKKEK